MRRMKPTATLAEVTMGPAPHGMCHKEWPDMLLTRLAVWVTLELSSDHAATMATNHVAKPTSRKALAWPSVN